MNVWVRRFAIASGAGLVAALATTSLLDASAAGCAQGEEAAAHSIVGAAGPSKAAGDAATERAAEPIADAQPAEREPARNAARTVETGRPAATRPGTDAAPQREPEPSADAADPGAPTPTAADCGRDVEQPGCRFLDPDAEQLAELARCGQIRFEMPHFIMSREMSPEPDDAWLDAANLSDDERAAFAEVGEVLREQLYAEMVELFVEAGRDRSWAEQTPFLGLVRALYELPSGEEDSMAAITRLSRERAGLQPPPGPDEALTIAERHVRATAGVASQFEALLGAKLGPERAAELRRLQDGWDGFHTQTRSQCEDGS